MLIHSQDGTAIDQDNPFPVTSVAGALVYGHRAVAGVGTPVVLGTATLHYGVTLRALPGNTGTIYVGGGTAVSASTGFPVKNTESVFVCVDNLSDIYLDTDFAGDGVGYIGS